MKLKILKDCSVAGAPAKPGDIVEVNEHRAKALTDNGYAEHHQAGTPSEHPRRAEAIEFIKSRGCGQEAAETIFEEFSEAVLEDLDQETADGYYPKKPEESGAAEVQANQGGTVQDQAATAPETPKE